MYGALFELCRAFDFWFLSITKFGMTTKFIMNVFVDNTHTHKHTFIWLFRLCHIVLCCLTRFVRIYMHVCVSFCCAKSLNAQLTCYVRCNKLCDFFKMCWFVCVCVVVRVVRFVFAVLSVLLFATSCYCRLLFVAVVFFETRTHVHLQLTTVRTTTAARTATTITQ